MAGPETQNIPQDPSLAAEASEEVLSATEGLIANGASAPVKGRPVLSNLKVASRKVRRFLVGEKKSTAEQDEIRKAYQGLINQKNLTVKVLIDNLELLQEKAMTDENAKKVVDLINSKDRVELESMLKEGREIFPEYAANIVNILSDTASSLDSMSYSLQASLPALTAPAVKTLHNSEATLESQREALQTIQNLVAESNASRDDKALIRAFNAETFNATESERNEFLVALRQVQAKEGAKVQGSYQKLAELSQGQLLTLKGIKKVNEKQAKDGESFYEKFKKEGLGAVQGTVKRGALGTGLAFLGLGGLDDIVEELADLKSLFGKDGAFSKAGDLLKKGGGIIAKGGRATASLATKVVPALTTAGSVAAGMGGAGLSAAGGLLAKGGKLAARGLKFVPGLGLIAAGGMAAYDGFKGFNDAENIAGLAPGKKATTSQKLGAGVSSAISGLTFGLVSSKTVYAGFSKAFDSVFGPKGMVSKITGVFSDTMEKFSFRNISDTFTGFFDSLFGSDGILGKLKALVLRVMDPMELLPKAKSVASSAVSSLSRGAANILPASVSKYLGLSGEEKTKQLIRDKEGSRSKAYVDDVGHLTIGTGHKVLPGEDPNRTLTKEEDDALLQKDIEKHQSFLSRIKVPITENQKAALTSFAFNVGPDHPGLNKIINSLNEGDSKGAADKLLKYDKAKDKTTGKYKTLPGLVSRRAEERALMLAPDSMKPDVASMSQKDKGRVSPALSTLNNSGMNSAVRDRRESRASNQASISSSKTQTPVYQPNPAKSYFRSTGTDDLTLAVMNTSLVD
jgi:lysozyme